jgi:Bacterial Ig-like domain (group 3)
MRKLIRECSVLLLALLIAALLPELRLPPAVAQIPAPAASTCVPLGQVQPGQLLVIQSCEHAVLPSLLGTIALPAGPRVVQPRGVTPAALPPRAAPGPDPALQTVPSRANSTVSSLSFAGVDYTGTVPPDTDLSVGDTQTVQWVNTSFAVFNKSTGALVYGPVAGNTLWQSLGPNSLCATENQGDPIVKFDTLASRWVMSQFAFATDTNGKSKPPYFQCVAVSQTDDATKGWNLYTFNYGNNFNDYGKLGVWPDAYYITYDFFGPQGGPRVGPLVCALDRLSMIDDLAAAQSQCYLQNANLSDILPADVDGSKPPPSGAPNYLLNFDYGGSSLNLWRFHIDFNNPGNTTLSGPTSIAVAPFTLVCQVNSNCVPQPDTPNLLDSIPDRLMNRLAYRNFGDHEALVANHTVGATGSQLGVRWYELRKTGGGTFGVYQQGTYSPDSSNRWLGSIAMDQAGDIAVGYSDSSSSVFPGINYTARAPADPLGTMQSEVVIKPGSSSQTTCLDDTGNPSVNCRWGDYSAMSIDPTDDCSFWYSNEYLKASTSNWSTWIDSFRFPTCGGPPGTQTTLVSSLNPSNTGQPVTFTATVTCANVVPTGNVTFIDGSTTLGVTQLSAAGQAALSTSSLAVGTHQITAAYAGDLNCAPSTSLPLPQVVNPAGLGVTLASNPNPSAAGQAVTFTATVTCTGFKPTGSVAFTVDGTMGTPVALNDSAAAFSTSTLGSGNHTVTAAYLGDANCAASTSAPLTQTVNQAGAGMTLTSSPSPSAPGQPVSFTATPPCPGVLPTGSVVFFDGGVPIATIPLNSKATPPIGAFTTSTLAPGSHSITATYSGGGGCPAATSNTLTQVVGAAVYGVLLTSSANPSTPGQPVTFAATPNCPNFTPTGIATFTIDGAAGTPVKLIGGVATLTSSSLAPGSHSVTAAYSGDGNCGAATSAVLAQMVTAAGTGALPPGALKNCQALPPAEEQACITQPTANLGTSNPTPLPTPLPGSYCTMPDKSREWVPQGIPAPRGCT